MTNPKLDIVNVTRIFKDVKALDNFSLGVSKGELISLLGPSGCGKSTALRIIAGLDVQNDGTIFIDGVDISKTPANKRNMGMVFQSYSLFPNMTALENVAFGLQMRKVSKITRNKKAGDLLELVGLPGLGHRYPHQLSGGQQQRIALARAIAFEPEILLLDEPLSALDAQVRAQIREEIRRIQLSLGITTIFVTHDQEEAMAISDRVAVMNSGKIEQIAQPEDLYKNPNSPFVVSFIGQVNRIQTKVSSDKTVFVLGRRLPVNNLSTDKENVEAYIRPESIVLAEVGQEDFKATVVLKSFLGPNTLLSVALENYNSIHVLLDSSIAYGIYVGNTVYLKLNITNVMVG